MILKITIILWIASFVVKFIIKAMANTLNAEERVRSAMFDKYPTRMLVATWLWILLTIASITMTIVTVITWK